jgi:hypothetical protein
LPLFTESPRRLTFSETQRYLDKERGPGVLSAAGKLLLLYNAPKKGGA